MLSSIRQSFRLPRRCRQSWNRSRAATPSSPPRGSTSRPTAISNAELVEAFNAYVERFNAANAEAIAAGEVAALLPSSVEFIEKASGIKSRYVMDKTGILDPERHAPDPPRAAQRRDLDPGRDGGRGGARTRSQRWGKPASEIGAVICAASNMQRPYPAMAIEVQQALGIDGFAFDMNVACSSATFGIKTAADFIASRLGQGGADGQPGDLLGPPELHATATATSSSATWRPR